MAFDVRTLAAILLAVLFVTFLAFTLAWRTNRTIPGNGLWAAGYGLFVVCMVALLLRGSIPLLPSVLITNAFAVAGSVAFWIGVRQFLGRPGVSLPIVVVGPAIALISAAVFTETYDSIAIRNGVTTSLQSVFGALTVWELLGRRWPKSAPQILVGGIFTFHCINNLVIATMPLWTGSGFKWHVFDSLSVLQGTYFLNIMLVCLSAFGFVIMMTERLQENLRTQAALDPLTGIFNRRAFEAAAKTALARSHRDGTPISALIMDLDHFKAVNDRHGHLVGDAILKQFVETAKTIVREQDILCRFGGEEFVALVPGATTREAIAIAERVRAAFAAVSVSSNGKPVSTTVSIGISTCESPDCELGALLSGADTAVYEAKDAGRNCVRFHAADSLSSRSISSSSHSSSDEANSA